MMALKTYMKIAAEERAWAYHLSTDRAEADYWNGIRLAKRAAREEGRKEGWKDGEVHGFKQGTISGKQEAARNLFTMGLLTHEQIAQAVGLPLEEVEKLAAEPAVQGI